jgi:hypothetical protein
VNETDTEPPFLAGTVKGIIIIVAVLVQRKE